MRALIPGLVLVWDMLPSRLPADLRFAGLTRHPDKLSSEGAMKRRVMGVVFLVVAVTACADDPVAMSGAGDVVNSAFSATDPLSKANRLSESLEQKVQLVRADLESRGYEVARGYWRLWGAEDCKAPIQAVGFCYGNNPTAPYMLAMLPQWKDEHVDQPLHHALAKGQRSMSAIYRLDHREAIVVLAELPPPARYFGVMTNVFTREATLNESDPIYQALADAPDLQAILFAVSPVPSRFMMISTFGDSNNNVTIAAQSGSVWSQQRFFVITPDRGMAAEVTEALGTAGVPAAHVFTEAASPAVVRPGLGAHADDFITYMRYALPDDPAAGDQWRKQLPLTILRVRDRNPSTALDPFPLPIYDIRRFNRDENELAGKLDAIVAAVKNDWKQPAAQTRVFFSLTDDFDLVGQHCLGIAGPLGVRGPMNCLGDNQDDEPLIGPSFRLDGDTVVAVVGTLGTETGNATYASLSVNWFPYMVGVLNLSDVDLKGTAASYFEDPDSDLFFVYYFARDCTGLEHCLEVSRKAIPSGGIMKAIVRNYVVPGTARGPRGDMLLMPRVIILDGKGR
jgi:hypothetical protein